MSDRTLQAITTSMNLIVSPAHQGCRLVSPPHQMLMDLICPSNAHTPIHTDTLENCTEFPPKKVPACQVAPVVIAESLTAL